MSKKGKVYAKTATITVIEEKGFGVLVYDGKNIEDQWVIPHDVFNATYKELENPGCPKGSNGIDGQKEKGGQ